MASMTLMPLGKSQARTGRVTIQSNILISCRDQTQGRPRAAGFPSTTASIVETAPNSCQTIPPAHQPPTSQPICGWAASAACVLGGMESVVEPTCRPAGFAGVSMMEIRSARNSVR